MQQSQRISCNENESTSDLYVEWEFHNCIIGQIDETIEILRSFADCILNQITSADVNAFHVIDCNYDKFVITK